MAFSHFLDAAFPDQNSMNGTESSQNNIPATVLETFIPGYGPISHFLLQTFGFDVTIFVSLGCVVWLVCKVVEYIYHIGHRLLAAWGMSSITVSNVDNIHEHLMKWLSEHHSIKSSRSLSAETLYKSAWEPDEDEIDASEDEEEDEKFLNFSNQEAKAPPRFIPHFGTHRFWHKGRLFLLMRLQHQSMDVNQFPSSFEKEDLTITTIGRSAQPIKELLQDAKNYYLEDTQKKTVIRRPAPKDMRRYGGRSCWTHNAHRPTRPMETVVLDAARKNEVLKDINEYLHPATPAWYANRGIPYRRGYLFYGPPGTGKTSLSFALAGVFGLDIYVISLLDPTLTEEDLGMLFAALPRRCIVLLEDIDTAGLIRKDKSDPVEKTTEEGTEWKVQDLANALKRASDASEEDKKKGISLSGLLNAIDGVASHEGRVLVMTTNRPETLDEALIRPGRVDLQVAFGFATRNQVKELFERMYSSDKSSRRRQAGPRSEKDIALSTIPGEEEKRAQLERDELIGIAKRFAEKIPEDTFSPAEVQGFLLKRKKKPKQALIEIDKWVESQVVIKANKSKVLDVQ